MNMAITINMDNDAFSTDPAEEVKRILNVAMDKFNCGSNDITLRDYNGNVVGTLTVTE